jgi:hypothetical protein
MGDGHFVTLGPLLRLRQMDVKHHPKTLVNYAEFLSTGGHDISQRYPRIQWNRDTSLLVVCAFTVSLEEYIEAEEKLIKKTEEITQ